MPTLTTTIEDNSPLIIYSSGWQAGSSSSDQLLDLYSASGFTLTNTAGNSASLIFNGTGITFYGAKRWNHGLYHARIDNVQYPSQNGSVPDPGLFQVPLFQIKNLTQGQHSVVFEYVGPSGSYVDLDFITWEGNVGETQGDKLYVHTFKDTDPAFAYDSSWSNNPADSGRFSGGTGHVTSTPGSSVTFTFKGDGVSLYGPVSPTGAPYTIQLDNAGLQYFNSSRPHYTPQMLLYQATNLGSGQHQVKMSYQLSTSAAQFLAIDYATVYTTIESSTGTTGSTTGAGLSTGPVVGIAIGSFAAGVLAVVALVFLLFRRRESHVKVADEKLHATPFDSQRPDVVFGLRSTASESNLQNRSPPVPFVAGGGMRKGHPNHRFNPQSDLGGASSASLSEPRFADSRAGGGSNVRSPQGTSSEGAGRSGHLHSSGAAATGSSSTATPLHDEAFPPDYVQATTSLRAG